MPINPTMISVDVEAAGPTPDRFALLSIGACVAADPNVTFYAELKPDLKDSLPDALAVSGLSLELLASRGDAPKTAMTNFAAWLETAVPTGQRPVMAAFNAPFDWLFVSTYFHRYVGHNPFGHSALDMKALYMGVTGSAWGDTGMAQATARYGIDQLLTHHALEDAIYQAVLLRHILAEREEPPLSRSNT